MLRVVLFFVAFCQFLPTLSAETVVIKRDRQTWPWNVARRFTHKGINYKLCTYTSLKSGQIIPFESINFRRILPNTVAMEVPEGLIHPAAGTANYGTALALKPAVRDFLQNLLDHPASPAVPQPAVAVTYVFFDTQAVGFIAIFCLVLVSVVVWKFWPALAVLCRSEVFEERQRELEEFSGGFEAEWTRAFYGGKKFDVEKKIDTRAGRVVIPMFGRDNNTFPNLREHASSVAQALNAIESQPFAKKFQRLGVEDVYSVVRRKRGVKFLYQMKA